jgi:hypothetical protein
VLQTPRRSRLKPNSCDEVRGAVKDAKPSPANGWSPTATNRSGVDPAEVVCKLRESRLLCCAAQFGRPCTSCRQNCGKHSTLPCNFPLPDSPSKRGAVAAGGCPSYLRSSKTVAKLGTPPAVPLNPNSRRGRTVSSLRQGRVAMEKITAGIDLLKDRLDVAVRPSGESFAVPRTGAGLDDLVARLKVLKPNLIVLEATGGLETVAQSACWRIFRSQPPRKSRHRADTRHCCPSARSMRLDNRKGQARARE